MSLPPPISASARLGEIDAADALRQLVRREDPMAELRSVNGTPRMGLDHAWAGRGFMEHGTDSDHVLGSDGTTIERAWKAALSRVQGVPAARSLGSVR